MDWMVVKLWAEWTDEKDSETIWMHNGKPLFLVVNMENINAIRPHQDGFRTIKTIAPPRKLNCNIIDICFDYVEAMRLANSEREKLEESGSDDGQ